MTSAYEREGVEYLTANNYAMTYMLVNAVQVHTDSNMNLENRIDQLSAIMEDPINENLEMKDETQYLIKSQTSIADHETGGDSPQFKIAKIQ